MGLADLFSRRRRDDSDAAEAASAGPLQPSRVLPKFVASLSGKPQPILLDLGPVVGANVTFFGEQVGCKIFVEDLSKDFDRHVKEGTTDALPAFFGTRFPQEPESVDGILCWDLFDYLTKTSAAPLAEKLTRLLKPDGALLAFFSTDAHPPVAKPCYTRHIVVDPSHLQYRAYPAACPKQPPMQNRDIQRMFEPLRITEQFLLKIKVRELLFRKPAGSL